MHVCLRQTFKVLACHRRFNSILQKYSVSRSYNSDPLKVLGIETSCDDTGCAVVNENSQVLGEALRSQYITHLRNGGINPIIAHELHRDNIEQVFQDALGKELSVNDVDAIAVTCKPGLRACLEVGVMFANYMARKFNKPIIPIHHMEAHALVGRMYYDVPFPFIVLLVSGGHCLLAVVNSVNDFLLLGKSLDDAPGEAFDKVARRLKMKNIPEYSRMSGGQAIEVAASKSTNVGAFEFPLPLKRYRNCNFSFSGLKDDLNRKIKQIEMEHNIVGDQTIPQLNDLCAGFQLAVSEHLALRTERAIEFCIKSKLIPENKRSIVVSGGVACNNFIFKSIQHIGLKTGFNVIRPPPHVCTDNGVMIAWNGIEKYKHCTYTLKSKIEMSDIQPMAPLGNSYIDEVSKSNIKVSVTRLKSLYNV